MKTLILTLTIFLNQRALGSYKEQSIKLEPPPERVNMRYTHSEIVFVEKVIELACKYTSATFNREFAAQAIGRKSMSMSKRWGRKWPRSTAAQDTQNKESYLTIDLQYLTQIHRQALKEIAQQDIQSGQKTNLTHKRAAEEDLHSIAEHMRFLRKKRALDYLSEDVKQEHLFDTLEVLASSFHS
jgi:hypothetical protein